MRDCPVDCDNAGGDDCFQIVLGGEWIVDINDNGGCPGGDDLTMRFFAADVAYSGQPEGQPGSQGGLVPEM